MVQQPPSSSETTQRSVSSETSQGSVALSPSVIASVAARAALAVYGVVGMADRNPIDGIARVLNLSMIQRGIDVRIGDAIDLDVYLIVEYGLRLSEVARNVQSAVKFAVERAIGRSVRAVNIHVQDLHIPRAKA